jgi:alcohol dehydrogenase class IV
MGLGTIAILRHQIGGGYNVAHGVASAIVFPYCIAFYRPLIDDQLIPIAKALGLPIRDSFTTAGAVVDWVKELINKIGLPTRLRNVGVSKEALEAIAEASVHDFYANETLKKLNTKQLLGVLEQAW